MSGFSERNQAQIIPARIREARTSRGYSLSELSNMIGVTSQAISQYELGLVKPSPVILMKMVEVLDFPLRFFRKPKAVTSQEYCNSAVFFRSMKSATKKDKVALKNRINWTEEIYQFIKRYIDFPESDLPDLRDLIKEDPDYSTIEEIASRLREHWHLGTGPIPSMVGLLQQKGFIISNIEFNNKKIDAFSCWHNNIPYIIHGTDKSSAVRSRFDLAHELGHLILHSKFDQTQISKKEVLDRIEDEANYFAGAFLLPQDSFPRDIMTVSIDHFIMLKKRWKVSVAAMIKRCERLNLLNENQVRYLFIQMTKRGIRTREPLDDVINLERPYLFKQAIELLLDNKVLTVDEILEQIPLNKKEIDSLLFLPEDLLARKEKILTLNLAKRKITS